MVVSCDIALVAQSERSLGANAVMLRLIAGLSRSLPLVIALVVLAVVIYLFMSWWKTPTRAKEIMIKVFLVLCSAIAIVFLLISGYAVLDHNTPVLELALSCALVGVVGLIITFICRYFFRKHHPHYKYEPNSKAKTNPRKGPQGDALDVITSILNRINDFRHGKR